MKGSTLVSVLIVSALISILLLGVLSSILHKEKRSKSIVDLLQAERDLSSGLAWLAYQDFQSIDTTIFISSFDTNKISIISYPWGIYKRVSITSSKTPAKEVYIGSAKGDYELRLSQNSVLNIGGRALIHGNAALPNTSYKSSVVNRVSPVHSEPIVGRIEEIEVQDFDTYTREIQSFRQYIERPSIQDQKNHFNFLVIEDKAALIGDSLAKNTLYYCKGSLRMVATYLPSSSILVVKNSRITNSIIGGQIIANDSLFCSHSQLLASSALVVCSDSSSYLSIADSCTGISNIVCLSRGGFQNSRLFVDANCSLIGSLTCDGSTQLEGEIKGWINSYSLEYSSPEAVYSSTLFDGRILEFSEFEIAGPFQNGRKAISMNYGF